MASEDAKGDSEEEDRDRGLDLDFEKMMGGGLAPQVCRALILSPVDAPAALRAALDLVGSPAAVISLGNMSAVYLDLGDPGPEDEAAQMMALLGEERPLPTEVENMARLVSKLSAPGAVAVVGWTSQQETTEDAPETGQTNEVTGNIIARRFVNGEPEASLSAGLVLAGISLAAEELLLGRISPDEVEDYREPGAWTGWLKGRGKR